MFQLIQLGLTTKVDRINYFASGKILHDFIRSLKYKSDVFHITGHVHFYVAFLSPKKTILTIHDVGHYEITLSGLKKWLYKVIWFQMPLARARYVTTISNFSKERIVRNFSVNPDKVKVIYNPVNPAFRPSLEPRQPAKVILQIGSGSNKNLNNLIESAKGLKCKLLLISKLDDFQVNKLKKYSIEFESKCNLSLAELVQVYHSADVLFFASTYEGFGLPIIEAQACGLPVITSNFGSMAEITENGKSAHLVDPYNVNEIRDGIEKIFNDNQYRSNLVANGLENAKRFSYQLIADQYLKLYTTL
ncbi:MAG: glycosyltransferase family 4 protein [Cyclobacteriaceae bacterium]|nr:glycosyltransferase family 4 protein [Cyclobacteriaceae bacterium]